MVAPLHINLLPNGGVFPENQSLYEASQSLMQAGAVSFPTLSSASYSGTVFADIPGMSLTFLAGEKGLSIVAPFIYVFTTITVQSTGAAADQAIIRVLLDGANPPIAGGLPPPQPDTIMNAKCPLGGGLGSARQYQMGMRHYFATAPGLHTVKLQWAVLTGANAVALVAGNGCNATLGVWEVQDQVSI